MSVTTRKMYMNIQKVQLCLEAQHHRGVQSDPVRGRKENYWLNLDESSGISLQTYAKERWDYRTYGTM